MTMTFFSVSAAVHVALGGGAASARALRWSTSVAIVGVSGRVVDDRAAAGRRSGIGGGAAIRTASTLAA